MPSQSVFSYNRDQLKKDFQDVCHWIFDLDNTLYPANSDVFSQIDEKMRHFIAQLLKLEHEDAFRLQKEYYKKYGTTLRGLILEHQVNVDDFLNYVHDIDHSTLTPDPHLAQLIEQLPGHCYIFTNGSIRHARNVIRHLGIKDTFKDIFDIVAADLMPKPHAQPYDLFMARTQIDPRKAVMFEDLSRNLIEPKKHGMRTVLIAPQNMEGVVRESWEHEGHEEAHIDYVTSHLGHFLEAALHGKLER